MSRINDVPALNTIGAQAANSPPAFISLPNITTLTGPSNIPGRPTNATEAGVSGFFVADFSGPITGNVAITLTLPAVGRWVPGDVIRVRLTPQTVAAHTVTVIDAGGGPALPVIPATITSTAFVDSQLNDAGTSWVELNGGGF